MPSAEAYFSAQADHYAARAHRGLWGLLKRFERTRLRGLAPKGRLGHALELGCGTGYHSGWVAARADSLTCVDVSAAMLRRNPVACAKLRADIDDLRLPGRYDLILCAGALEFVRSPADVLVRSAALLRPGGRLLALLPSRSALGRCYRRFHRRHGVAVHLFSLAQIRAMAAAAGLQLLRHRAVPPWNRAVALTRVAA
jgi:SAM-dependent methyltransferase